MSLDAAFARRRSHPELVWAVFALGVWHTDVGFSPAKRQTPTMDASGIPTQRRYLMNALHDVLPEYIQEFFLSEAVRSQEHGEVQLTVAGTDFRDLRSAADGKSAALDFEYGITRRFQFAMELPYGIQSTETSELPVSWSTEQP